MRKTGPRWYGFGVPLACIAGLLFGDIEATYTMIFAYMATLLFSLNAPDAFSRAAARLMSTKKVMGSLLLAVILSLILPVVLFFTAAEADPRELIVLGPLALLVISRCFEELFASQNDPASAAITNVLTAAFLGGALSLVGEHTYGNPESSAELAAAGVIALISGGIALGFSKKLLPSVTFALLKQIPAALGRFLLYPVLCMVLLLLDTHFGANYALSRAMVICGLVGLILLELSKSTFRRGREESAGIKTGIALAMLCATGGLFLLSMFWWTGCLPFCHSLLLAAGAAALMLYAPFDWESIAATLVMLAAAVLIAVGITPAHFSFPYEMLLGPFAAMAVCGIMFRQWGELARGARANRIRKKAMKASR